MIITSNLQRRDGWINTKLFGLENFLQTRQILRLKDAKPTFALLLPVRLQLKDHLLLPQEHKQIVLPQLAPELLTGHHIEEARGIIQVLEDQNLPKHPKMPTLQ